MKNITEKDYLAIERKKLIKKERLLNRNSLLNKVARIIVGAEVIAMIQTLLFTFDNTSMMLICKFVDFAVFNIISNNLIYATCLYLANMIIGLMGGIIFDKLYTKVLGLSAKLSNIGKKGNEVELTEHILKQQIEIDKFDKYCEIGARISGHLPKDKRANTNNLLIFKNDDPKSGMFFSKLEELEKLIKRRTLITESLRVKPNNDEGKINIIISHKTIKYYFLFHSYMSISSLPYLSRIFYSFATNSVIYDSLFKALELIFISLGIAVAYTTVYFTKRESATLKETLKNIEKSICNKEIFELGRYNFDDLDNINTQIETLMDEIAILGAKLVVQDGKDTTTTNKTLNKPKLATNRTKYTPIKPIIRYSDEPGRPKTKIKLKDNII